MPKIDRSLKEKKKVRLMQIDALKRWVNNFHVRQVYQEQGDLECR